MKGIVAFVNVGSFKTDFKVFDLRPTLGSFNELVFIDFAIDKTHIVTGYFRPTKIET